jgi:hypothetical protein
MNSQNPQMGLSQPLLLTNDHETILRNLVAYQGIFPFEDRAMERWQTYLLTLIMSHIENVSNT